jgi:HEAT repeat protein
LTGIGDPASKHIIACLRAEDLAVRDTALNWLTFYERDPKPYLPGIINLLKDDLPRARLAAAFTLEMMGPKARTALPALQPLLKDADPAVRGRAAEAINRIDRKD